MRGSPGARLHLQTSSLIRSLTTRAQSAEAVSSHCRLGVRHPLFGRTFRSESRRVVDGANVRLCRVEEALGHPVERCSASTPDQAAMARLERQDPRLNSMDGGGMWMLRSIWREPPRRGTLSANVSGIHCSRVWVGPSSVAKTWLVGSR